jgi:hypothetical protein
MILSLQVKGMVLSMLLLMLYFPDIDECTVNDPPPCPGHCKNTPGNFSCPSEKPPSSSHSAALILAVGTQDIAVCIVSYIFVGACHCFILFANKSFYA